VAAPLHGARSATPARPTAADRPPVRSPLRGCPGPAGELACALPQGLAHALRACAPAARPAVTELSVTGVSLALLCHGGLGAPAADPLGESSNPAAPGGEAAPERARRDPAGEAGAADAAGARRGDGGGGPEAAGRPAEPARHELLRQWGLTAVLHIVPGGQAGGAGGPGAGGARAGRSGKGGGGAGRVPPPPKGPHAAANGAGPPPEHAARANGRLDALPEDALRERRQGAGDDGGGCGVWQAAAGAGRARAQVRVDVQLRALVPVVSAAGAAAALRMAARAERCARFWAHWRRRPGAAVAAAPAAWWRHAVGAARAACREVGRRPPVPLGALPSRRARRLAYQARPAGRARRALFFRAARPHGRTGGRSHAWSRGAAQVPLAAAALSFPFTTCRASSRARDTPGTRGRRARGAHRACAR